MPGTLLCRLDLVCLLLFTSPELAHCWSRMPQGGPQAGKKVACLEDLVEMTFSSQHMPPRPKVGPPSFANSREDFPNTSTTSRLGAISLRHAKSLNSTEIAHQTSCSRAAPGPNPHKKTSETSRIGREGTATSRAVREMICSVSRSLLAQRTLSA